MGSTATAGPDGAVLGPFAVLPYRAFAAWVEVLALDGATSVDVVLEESTDGQRWTSKDSVTGLVPGMRHVFFREAPESGVRLVVTVNAPGAWAGAVLLAYDGARGEDDSLLAARAADAERGRRDAALEQVRADLGLTPPEPTWPSPAAFLGAP